jgi:4-aminobutyrate aminotransferase/(S)-3-amino-2-methylpropionate transaminase
MTSSPPPPAAQELPGPRTRALLLRGRFDVQSIYRSVLVDDERSLGLTLVDADGNSFLDLFGSFALSALGFNHPRLLALARSDAFARAAANPTSTPFVTTRAWLESVDEIQRRAPTGMGGAFFVDAGGEGVDAALKAAFVVHGESRRAAAGLPRDPLQADPAQVRAWMDNSGTDAVAVCFEGAFHGRGLGPLSATRSKAVHKADAPAFPWPAVPFPAMRWPPERHSAENEQRERESLAALERVLDQHRGRVAAILVEPMQSEGGDRHAAPSFYRSVQRLAGQAGAALILDEVQTGLGSTGTLWAHEQFELPRPPDLVTFGKKMQMGGYFAAPSHVLTQFGRQYQTRNGDRARALLAVETMRVIEDERLLENARATGAHFLDRLRALERRHPTLVSEPRGWGLLLAFDLPSPQLRDELLKRTLRHGVMGTYTGTRSVRLRPPLIASPADADRAFVAFDTALSEMHA